MPILYIGIDDVDGADSPDTREVIQEVVRALEGIGKRANLFCVPLPRVPSIEYTNENRAYALRVEMDPGEAVDLIGGLLADLASEDSNPGLAIVIDEAYPTAVALAEAARSKEISRLSVERVSEQTGIQVLELGGTGKGVIGAFTAAVLASVGRAEIP